MNGERNGRILEKWEDSIVSPLKFTSRTIRTKEFLLNTKTHMKEPPIRISEGGKIGKSKGAGWEEGQGRWLQTQLDAHPGSSEHRVVKSGGSPHTRTWSVRGAEGVSCQEKASPFPTPPRQSWVEVAGKL